MSKKQLAIYRLPIGSATQSGNLSAVVDRNKQVYLNGQKVVEAQPNGDFLMLTLANNQTFYVKTSDYQTLRDS